MPRNTPATTNAPNALAEMPDDVRADLLRAQTSEITTFQRLPRVKVMPAGAGLFEFTDTNDTVREFKAIILNSHSRNILWDRAVGEVGASATASDSNDRDNGPACSSNDGKWGTPRTGFTHLGLGRGRVATGTERIECATCPYNQWNSIGLVRPDRAHQKGKAVTNQRSLYLLLEDREAPMELILTPTSLQKYDAYLMALANQQVPVQAVLTHFKQEIKNGTGGIRWGQVVFENAGILDGPTFALAMAKRQQYRNAIMPAEVVASGTFESQQQEIVGQGIDEDEAPF